MWSLDRLSARTRWMEGCEACMHMCSIESLHSLNLLGESPYITLTTTDNKLLVYDLMARKRKIIQLSRLPQKIVKMNEDEVLLLFSTTICVLNVKSFESDWDICVLCVSVCEDGWAPRKYKYIYVYQNWGEPKCSPEFSNTKNGSNCANSACLCNYNVMHTYLCCWCWSSSTAGPTFHSPGTPYAENLLSDTVPPPSWSSSTNQSHQTITVSTSSWNNNNGK